jgi:sec-independent protein translocase protein TatC
LIVVVAAVLTPPDVVSQLLLAVPLLGLFELSILFMRRD